MGGVGSGRRACAPTRTCLEDRMAIDIREWHRDGLLVEGSRFYACSIGRAGVRHIVDVTIDEESVVLVYRFPTGPSKWKELELWVDVRATPCNFGGFRQWFVCPVCRCGAAKLYLGSPYFSCRRCLKLPYRSQGETAADRARRRARKIRARLGASMNLANPIGEKPRGMHWRTFERLCAEVRSAEAIAIDDMARLIRKTTAL